MSTQEQALAQLTAMSRQLSQITAALSEATTELRGLNDTIQHQNVRIIELETAIDAAVNTAANDQISPELQAALDDVMARVVPISVQSQGLADIMPNVVTNLENALPAAPDQAADQTGATDSAAQG